MAALTGNGRKGGLLKLTFAARNQIRRARVAEHATLRDGMGEIQYAFWFVTRRDVPS